MVAKPCVEMSLSVDCNIAEVVFKGYPLTLLHSKRPKLYAILAFLSAIGLRLVNIETLINCGLNRILPY